MIYVTGDCHSDFVRFNKENFLKQEELTKDDYVIICGDFGGVWNVNEESKREKWWLDWLENKSYTTLFVDGNHENAGPGFSIGGKENIYIWRSCQP